MAWELVRSLVALRNEFNVLAPGRDKGADGSIGDSAHTSRSDHTPDESSIYLRDHDADSKNEVHALDIDSTGPFPRSFGSIVQAIIAGEKAKWLDADDVCRLEYVIFNRKIYSRERDFAPRDYTGSDPHTNHAHFSGRYLTASENDTRPWGVLIPAPPDKGDDDMADAAEFWASAAKAARGDADATAGDRTNRNNAVQVLRFALGLPVDQQTSANLPSGQQGQLARIEALLAELVAGADGGGTEPGGQ